jgi:hypothetical protein
LSLSSRWTTASPEAVGCQHRLVKRCMRATLGGAQVGLARIRQQLLSRQRKLKTAPCGSAGVAQRRPPWRSIIERQIDSPRPTPLDLVVKNASKIRSVTPGSIPVPESFTETRTPPSCSGLVLISNLRGPPCLATIASMPFIIKLRTTCCSWTRSAITLGRPGLRSVSTATSQTRASARVRVRTLFDDLINISGNAF